MPHDTPEQLGVQQVPCGPPTVEHSSPLVGHDPLLQNLPQPTAVPHALPAQLAAVQLHIPLFVLHVYVSPFVEAGQPVHLPPQPSSMPHDTPVQFGVQHVPCGSETVEHTCPGWHVPPVQYVPQPALAPHA
jgi:hypothetical protein